MLGTVKITKEEEFDLDKLQERITHMEGKVVKLKTIPDKEKIEQWDLENVKMLEDRIVKEKAKLEEYKNEI